MKKIRVGVLGAYRGNSMIKYCKLTDNAELVAICDKAEDALEKQKELNQNDNITYYKSFDEFIKHDMDAVVLANYANEHAPFAIRCLKAGKHVYSECLPCQHMKEAIELIETVEETGLIYAFGENYCFMKAPYEMRRLYKQGVLGEFEYGEGEYIHNCEPIWHSITYGDPDHWRNRVMHANFYCSHSIGPLIHITGLRPVSVVGFEGRKTERRWRTGGLGAQFGIEMIELENGGIIKSIHGDLYKESIWYSVYGSKGRMESVRFDAEAGNMDKIYVNVDAYSGAYEEKKIESYEPRNKLDELSKEFGHGGSDFHSMYHFIEKIRGNEDADVIDVYEAMDIVLPGMFAYRSVIAGGIPLAIPNLRIKEERDAYRNDTTCTDKYAAGDMLLPTFSKGNPEIPDEVYAMMKQKWDDEYREGSGYVNAVYGDKKEE